jgi:hypothetical protein
VFNGKKMALSGIMSLKVNKSPHWKSDVNLQSYKYIILLILHENIRINNFEYLILLLRSGLFNDKTMCSILCVNKYKRLKYYNIWSVLNINEMFYFFGQQHPIIVPIFPTVPCII